MTPTPKKLTPEMIEAAAMIDVAACTSPLRHIDDCRTYFNAMPQVVVPFLAAASKHTGADDLAEALTQIVEVGTKLFTRQVGDMYSVDGYEDYEKISEEAEIARAALAKHRALMGRAMNSATPASASLRLAFLSNRSRHPMPPKTFNPIDVWRALAPEVQEQIGALAIASEIALCSTVHVDITTAEYWRFKNTRDAANSLLGDLIGGWVDRDIVEPDGWPIPADLNPCGIRQCTACGCTDAHACNPPCSWAGPTTCSTCAPKEPA